MSLKEKIEQLLDEAREAGEYLDLSGLDLSGVNLTGADLAGVSGWKIAERKKLWVVWVRYTPDGCPVWACTGYVCPAMFNIANEPTGEGHYNRAVAEAAWIRWAEGKPKDG